MNVSVASALRAWIAVESQRRLGLQVNRAIFVFKKFLRITLASRIAVRLSHEEIQTKQQHIENALFQFSIPLLVSL